MSASTIWLIQEHMLRQVEEADFVLAQGTNYLRTDKEGPLEFKVKGDIKEVDPVLKRAAERKLPMLVANPDFTSITGGKVVHCPGKFAKRYAELGGSVQIYGKPNAEHFWDAMKLMDISDKQKVSIPKLRKCTQRLVRRNLRLSLLLYICICVCVRLGVARRRFPASRHQRGQCSG